MLEPAEIGYTHSLDPGEPIYGERALMASTGKPRLSVSDREAEILTALAAGRSVIEIGTGLGVSTRALARFAKAVFTLDPDPWVQRTIVPDLVAEFPYVITALETTQSGCVLPNGFDLAFIDGSHTTDAVSKDLHFVQQFLHQCGLIVCHDARYTSVRAALWEADWRYIYTEHILAYRYLG